MRYTNTTDAKKHLLEMIREADESFERYCIVRRGEPKAILMSVEDYGGWLETLELVGNKRAMAEIRRARRELDAGKGIPFKNILERLGGEEI